MNSKPAQLGVPRASARSIYQIQEQPSRPQHEPGEKITGSSITRSFNSNTSGPTPKRTRPRRHCKTPSTHQPNTKPKFSTTKFARGSTSKVKRYPLQDLDLGLQNRAFPSPRKQEFAGETQSLTSEMAKLDNENACTQDDIDLSGLSFNESDIFTSTERRPSSPLRTRFKGFIDDETTAEF